jgi:hypothetical protein
VEAKIVELVEQSRMLAGGCGWGIGGCLKCTNFQLKDE